MGRIVVNKHVDEKGLVTSDKFVNKGELIISNEDGYEGIFILNKSGNIVFIPSDNKRTGHVFLSESEYQILINEGQAEVNGEIITYDDDTYYAVYESDGDEN